MVMINPSVLLVNSNVTAFTITNGLHFIFSNNVILKVTNFLSVEETKKDYYKLLILFFRSGPWYIRSRSDS